MPLTTRPDISIVPPAVRRACLALLLLPASLPGWASAAPPSSALATPPAPGTPAPYPWWLGFADATLNLLEHLARTSQGGVTASAAGGVSDADPRVADLYLAMRTLAIRVRLQAEILALCDQRLVLLQAESVTPDTRATQQARQASWTLLRRDAAALHAALVRALGDAMDQVAQRTRQERSALQLMLAPALADGRPPTFGLPVPQRLPASVIEARRDVGLARRSSIGGTGASPGWIEPAGPGDDLAAIARAASLADVLGAAEGAAPELDSPVRGVRQTSQQRVARALGALLDHQRTLAAWEADAQRQLLVYGQALERHQRGQADLGEWLDAQLPVLLQADRLAVLRGELMADWVALNTETGGLAAQATREALQASTGAAP